MKQAIEWSKWTGGGWAKAPEDWTHSRTLARGHRRGGEGRAASFRMIAGLETGDTADLEICATGLHPVSKGLQVSAGRKIVESSQ